MTDDDRQRAADPPPETPRARAACARAGPDCVRFVARPERRQPGRRDDGAGRCGCRGRHGRQRRAGPRPGMKPQRTPRARKRRTSAAPGGQRSQGDLLAAARRARLPLLRRQALLHPVGIDDAGPAQGRPAGGQQIPLWLVLGLAQLPHLPALGGPDLGRAAAARRHRHRHPARQQFRLYQAGDRPARRHHPADRRPGLPERRAAPPRGAAAGDDPGRRKYPLPGARLGTRRARQDGRWYCRMPVFRETIPDGTRRSYDTIDRLRFAG